MMKYAAVAHAIWRRDGLKRLADGMTQVRSMTSVASASAAGPETTTAPGVADLTTPTNSASAEGRPAGSFVRAERTSGARRASMPSRSGSSSTTR